MLTTNFNYSKFAQIKRYITPSSIWDSYKYEGYATQYLDKLNIKFIEMAPSKRENNISIFAKRLAVKDQQYLNEKQDVHEFAREQGIHPNEVRYYKEYPEEIEW